MVMHKEKLEFIYLDTIIEEIEKITGIELNIIKENIDNRLEENDISIYGLEYGFIYLNALADYFPQNNKIKNALDELLKTNDPCTLIAITD